MARVGIAAIVALSIACAALGIWLAPLALPAGAAAPGLTLAGARVPAALSPWRAIAERLKGEAAAGLALEALVHELGQRFVDTPVELSISDALPGVRLSATLGELGLHVDEALTVQRARAVGRQGSPLQRHAELARARSGGVDVPLALAFERQVFFERFAALASELSRRARPARYPFLATALVLDVPGRALDLEHAGDALWSSAGERAAAIGAAPPPAAQAGLALDLAFVPLRAKVNATAFAHFAPRATLAAYSTRFRLHGDQAARARNIAVAASRIDGLIVLPGERISFNQVVGERSLDNGFFDSWELLDGEFVRGVGGGTCQVSSTLNAAALHAGLTIVESFTRSRPLAYIEKGLDATVAWPFVDLKIENSWRVPVVIQALVRGNALTVRVVAESMPGRVALRSEVKETYPFPRVVEVGRMPRGSFRLKQAGISGYRIQRTRTIWAPDAAPRREVSFKRYRPTPELFVVAPGFDLRELPPLPEGAEGHEPSPDLPEPSDSEREPSLRVPGFLG